MSNEEKRVGLRLDVTEEERDLIRTAAALAGYKSMADFSRAVVLQVASLFQPSTGGTEEPTTDLRHTWWERMTPEKREWFSQRVKEGMANKKAQEQGQ